MEPIIKISNLSYAYRGHEDELVLEGIDLEIETGEFLAIAGRTGSGKSSLIYTMNGLVPHSFGGKMEGRVLVCGLDTREVLIPELARQVGMVLQSAESQLVGLTVVEDIEFGPENVGMPLDEIKERAAWAADVVGITDLLDRSPWTLSGGQKQRLAIAAALSLRPKVLLLDNPTAELDPLGKEDVLQTIARLNREHDITIVIIDQELQEVIPYASRLALLDQGRIALLGTPAEVLDQGKIVREIGVKLPDVCEAAYQLRKTGKWPGQLPVTVDNAMDRVAARYTSTGRKAKIYQEPAPGTDEIMIRIDDLHFGYPDGPEVVKGIDLTIHRGEFICLMGPNGTGKTTLAKHFNGLLKPVSGSVEVQGVNTGDSSVTELATRVGYVFQNPDHQIFAQTVAEELAFGPRNLGWEEDRIDKAIKRELDNLGLSEQGESEPFLMGLAERKLIAIGSILIMGPELLVLDEPATGADYSVALRIMRYISDLHQRGLTVFIITHDVSIAANYASRLIVMKDGKIALDGPPRDLLYQREALRESYVTPPQVIDVVSNLSDNGRSLDIIRVDELVEVLSGE